MTFWSRSIRIAAPPPASPGANVHGKPKFSPQAGEGAADFADDDDGRHGEARQKIRTRRRPHNGKSAARPHRAARRHSGAVKKIEDQPLPLGTTFGARRRKDRRRDLPQAPSICSTSRARSRRSPKPPSARRKRSRCARCRAYAHGRTSFASSPAFVPAVPAFAGTGGRACPKISALSDPARQPTNQNRTDIMYQPNLQHVLAKSTMPRTVQDYNAALQAPAAFSRRSKRPTPIRCPAIR